MIRFLEKQLAIFKKCFSRYATYCWFVIIVLGLMTRYDKLGVTSIIRSLSLDGMHYEKILHFFRSTAYSKADLKETWLKILKDSGLLLKHGQHYVLCGDGTKVSKEARFMPGIKKQYQESENSAKASYIYGHLFGGLAVLAGNDSKGLAVPIEMELQDGLSATAEWENGDAFRSESHVVRMIGIASEAAEALGESYLVLDRYFLTVPALTKLRECNCKSCFLDIITRTKSNCIAYEEPPVTTQPSRGRPRKKGAAIKLRTLFESHGEHFQEATVTMYGKQEQVSYYCTDLLWGQKLYQKLRFVLVKSDRGNVIFACTDLQADPTMIIEAYAHRFKIESLFREFKQQIGGFCYRFWSKSVKKLDRYKRKDDPDPLSLVKDPEVQDKILEKIRMIENYVQVSCIAMGLSQMLSLNKEFTEIIRKQRYLRTSSENKVSEATVMDYLRKHLFHLLLRTPCSEITEIILSCKCFQDNDEEQQKLL